MDLRIPRDSVPRGRLAGRRGRPASSLCKKLKYGVRYDHNSESHSEQNDEGWDRGYCPLHHETDDAQKRHVDIDDGDLGRNGCSCRGLGFSWLRGERCSRKYFLKLYPLLLVFRINKIVANLPSRPGFQQFPQAHRPHRLLFLGDAT